MKKILYSLLLCTAITNGISAQVADLIQREKQIHSATLSSIRENKGAVAYLGPANTFSHLVALRRFSKSVPLVAQPDIAAIFDFLRASPKCKAIVPISNSAAGPINETVDLLMANAGSIHILEELSLEVRLALLGRSGQEIKRIYSHFVPLRHYQAWLMKSFPKARIIPTSSTAMAAQKASVTPYAAALASSEAASAYGLSILQFPVSPEKNNVTRFLVIGQQKSKARFASRWNTFAMVQLKNTKDIHSFLRVFPRYCVSVHMLAISRHSSIKRPTFAIEVNGSTKEKRIQDAFEEAAQWCKDFVILDSYPSYQRYSPSKNLSTLATSREYLPSTNR